MKQTNDTDLRLLSVLIVDDEPDIRRGLVKLLSPTGAHLIEADSAETALVILRDEPIDLVISDIKMKGMSGVGLLREITGSRASVQVILMTGFGTIELAVECLQAGAIHFLTKPFDNDELLLTVVRTGKKIVTEKSLRASTVAMSGIIAIDPAMHAVLDLVDQVAVTRVPVLIYGESGTGKELVARAIHLKSGMEKPLVAVNCAALPDTLLESELFGFRKGAFTGAERHYDGIFKRADGSTLFLDEVSSMSPAFQAKLLRVLQEKSISPLGSEELVRTDFRLIAAGNRDMPELVRNGQFREDLFYRLHVFHISIPPLRDRPADIEPLALHFITLAAKVCLGNDAPIPSLSAEALAELRAHRWPGNVRELQNAVQRAVIVCKGSELRPHHFFLNPSSPASSVTPESGESYEDAKQRILDSFQRQFIEGVLERTHGNISHAADECGLTRAAIQKIMRRLNIDRSHFDHE